jgi:hypothetical protein
VLVIDPAGSEFFRAFRNGGPGGRPCRPRRPAAVGTLSWDILWAALALMLVLEGLFPFLSPGGWRRTLRAAAEARDGARCGFSGW